MVRFILVIFLWLTVPASVLLSQKYAEKPFELRDSYGIFGSFNLNQHSGKFTGLPNINSCCPGYESGTGFGYSFGALVDLPLAAKWELGIRVAYSGLNGMLTRIEPTYVFDPAGHGTAGEFEHSIDATLSSASVMPMLSYRVTDRVALNAGLRTGMYLTHTLIQKEEIKSPSFGTFEGTGSRVRNRYDGEIPNPGIDFTIIAGMSYLMPMNTSYTIFLVPEAFITYGIIPVSSGQNWHVMSFNAGLALVYSPRKIIPVIPALPPPYPALPPPPDEPVLAANITAVSVDENGVESNVSIIKVEESLTTQTHPLLNYIFFDENSAVLPDRYQKFRHEDAAAFDKTTHFDSHTTLDVYYDVLNIIARRALDDPQANLTVSGYNCGQGPEKNNMQLSKDRAEAVRNYLVDVWNVPASRIRLASGSLPPVHSSSTEEAGNEENRRVEITSSSPDVLEPIVVRDTVRKLFPPKMLFKPVVNSDIGVEKWTVTCSQSGEVVKSFTGSGEPPAVIEWDLGSEKEGFISYDKPLVYQIVVTDKDNKDWLSNQGALPIMQKTYEYERREIIADKEIDQFTLTLFDFDKSDLDKRNMKAVESAKKRIKNNSIITIKGYTDQLGEEKHNLLLSQRRAIAAAKSLGVNPGIAEGLGESVKLYENKYPEERIYSRSVIINIETPVK